MEQNNKAILPQSAGTEGIVIDYKRVLSTALRNWWVAVISLAITLSIAWAVNRYSVRLYQVTASIILKETEETSSGELVYKNVLSDPYRNYLNELYILKSAPLIQSVLEDLNFGSSFYREGTIRISEIYNYPVYVKVLSRDVDFATFQFTIIDDNTFEMRRFESEVGVEPATFKFGDTVTYKNIRLVTAVRDPNALPAYHGVPHNYVYRDPRLLTDAYVSKLSVDWAQEGSGVIYLGVTGPVPTKEIDFVNGLIKKYQDHDLEKKNTTAARTVEFIRTQLKDIADSLSQVENVLERFKKQNKVTDLGAEAQRLYEKVETLELQLGELSLRSNYQQYLIDYINQNSNLDQVIAPTAMGITDEGFDGINHGVGKIRNGREGNREPGET
ncbi:MAG: hypothetical protein WDO15_10335 [Bacteroidota bacterium]